MKISVLASGSKGNCCYVESNNGNFLIDLGTTSLYIEKQLKTIDKTGKDIKGIFITHTHADHVNGLQVFIKKYPVYTGFY
jgi:phosphoribosyl 1,2-cyclic phosphodiesterase